MPRRDRLDHDKIAPLLALTEMGEQDRAGEVVNLFLDSFAGQLDCLLDHVARGDLDRLRDVSRNLRRSSASVGASMLETRCAEMESLARTGTTCFMTAAMAGILDEFRAVRPELEALTTAA